MKTCKFTVGKTTLIEDYTHTKTPVAELITREKLPRIVGYIYPSDDSFNIDYSNKYLDQNSTIIRGPKISFRAILDSKVEKPSNRDDYDFEERMDYEDKMTVHLSWADHRHEMVMNAIKGVATLTCLERQNWWSSKAWYNYEMGVGDITRAIYIEEDLPVNKKKVAQYGYLSDGRHAKVWYPSGMELFVLEVLKYLEYSGYKYLTTT